jgi:predicted RNA-binding Zn-ribbon protein involved in translation (DUF1610 family)
MNDLDGKTCFICGRYLLNNSLKDLAYMEVHTGSSAKAKPDKYFLFTCPSCGKTAHKRCWYDVGERRSKDGLFGKTLWRFECPSCHQVLSPTRTGRPDWKLGYQIPGHGDAELIELLTSDVLSWKASRAVGVIGKAIDGLFSSIGLGALTSAQRNAVSQAANRIGKSFGFVTSAVAFDATPQQRRELRELRCHNCGAPLPLPGLAESAVVCPHCGTAHLLPT